MKYLRVTVEAPKESYWIDVEVPDDLSDDEIWQIVTEKVMATVGHEVTNSQPYYWKGKSE